MRSLFRLFLCLWFVSTTAQQHNSSTGFCPSRRSYDVNNCTECPMYDRVNIPMAECDNREGRLVCTCIDYPAKAVAQVARYYVGKKGNKTQCVASWETAPYLHTATKSVCMVVLLYVAAHFLYIAVSSGMCCCAKHGCMEVSVAALSFGICYVFYGLYLLVKVVTQNNIPLALINLPSVLIVVGIQTQQIGQILFYTSVLNVAYRGEDKACCRYGIRATFWAVGAAQLVASAVTFISSGLGILPAISQAILFALGNVFIVMAHQTMRKVVNCFSESANKPPLISKLDDLCCAICRYYYPSQFLYFTGFAFAAVRLQCLLKLGAISEVWSDTFYFIYWVGLTGLFYACALEGQPVPTFPVGLCRREEEEKLGPLSPGATRPRRRIAIQKTTGLQFSSQLANAIDLLIKHGLATQKQKDSPVEAAIEPLLSTSTLQVAAAPDNMDLTSCVDHFLDHCVTDGTDQPIGKLLRAGNQHILNANTIRKLHLTVDKCLKWSRDPARPAIYDTTIDEAAAIMLYTQASCIYPRLNSALRDHMNPDKLKPFLPYLKLLLTGLYKLPLIRAKVYRGIRLDLHEVYDQLAGKVFTWWAFSSTTLNRELMKTPTFLGTKGKRTLFSIDAIGVNIADFSAFPKEAELLLLPGTSLTVEKGINIEPDYWEYAASVRRRTVQEPGKLQQEQQQDKAEQRQQEEKTEDKKQDQPQQQDEAEQRQQEEKTEDKKQVQPQQQEEKQQEQLREEKKQEDKLRREASSASVLTSLDEISVSKPVFQNTDFTHPHWDKYVNVMY